MSSESSVAPTLGVKSTGSSTNSTVKIEWCDYLMLSPKTRLPSGTKFLIGIVNDAFKRFDSKIHKEVKVSRDGKPLIYTTPISDITFFSWRVTFSLPYCNTTLPNDVHRNSLFKFVIFYFKFHGWYIWAY